MNNNKSQKILDKSYADSLPEIIDYIVAHDEQSKAAKFSKILEKAINENINELKLRPNLLDFYEKIILKLKFACLPVLEDKEVFGLIKNNFCFQLEIKDYDFFRKLNAKFLNIIVVEDRNKFKEDLKKMILENNERITPNYEIKFIKDWVKNYITKVGLDIKDNLAGVQYLMALKNNKSISSKEYAGLTALFKFYDILNIPSDTPEGFEEEPLITIGGKLYIFRKGVLEAVPGRPDIAEAMRLTGELKPENAVSAPSGSADNFFLSEKPTPSPLPPLAELEQALKEYSESSFEYKAISQEISRLKRSELKKAQKSDAKS